MANKSKTATESEVKFGKEQFIESKSYAEYRTLLKVLLKDGETYTIAEAKAALDAVLGRKEV